MDIRSEILDYINCNETTGALLVTGKWGCGKSFLIKEIANELNEAETAAIAVISLFGLDNIPAINKRVKDEYLSFLIGNTGKAASKIAKTVGQILKGGLEVASTAANGNAVLSSISQGLSSALNYNVFDLIKMQNTIEKDGKTRKFVIVFDDLERSGLAHKDLLGTINEYLENLQIKVVIIADEEKIKDDEYKDYKEKLISRTIKMANDYNMVLDGIIEHYSEVATGYRDFLIENKALLKQVFWESKTDNIRAFKCILADFERVYAAWKDTAVPADNMKWVLYSFGAEVYLSKMPPKEEPAPENKYPLFLNREEEKQFLYKGRNESDFMSLFRWIRNGLWDKAQFVDELQNRYLVKDDTPLVRFLTYNFWGLRQQDIDEGLPQAVELAYEGALSKDDLITLIGRIHTLREFSILPPVDIDYSKIEAGFDKRFDNIQNGTIFEPKARTFVEKSRVDEGAYTLLEKIERFEDRLIAAENRRKFLDYLAGDSGISSYKLSGLYIEELDEEWLALFISKYDTADNYEKRELALSLLGLTFDFHEYSTPENIQHTKDRFGELAAYLSELKTDDAITGITNKSFLEEIRKRYDNEQS